ncbi:MAG: hypothetical protein ACI8TX_003725 [Hyphomicrobiaceae bacterium]|jgi:hypothetical protein
MTTAGMCFLALSWAAIIGFNIFCLVRLAKTHRPNDSKSGSI